MNRGKGWRTGRRPLAVIGRGNKAAPRLPAGFQDRFLPEGVGPELLLGRTHFGVPEPEPEVDEAPIWTPGDGDAQLDGGAAGTLTLLWVGLGDLRAGLRLAGQQPQQVAFDRAQARAAFLDGAGRPVPAAGEIRLGGEVVRFARVSVIRAWG
jgi:hypothetical protein